MGLIDFIKNVGHKLDVGAHNQPAAQASQPIQNQAAQGPTQQQLQELEDRKKVTALTSLVNQMGFKAQNLLIDVQGERVTVKGTVDSQEEKEKIVLLLGNTQGIGSVDDQLQLANPQPQAAPPAQYYDVKSGDSLSKIAKQVYGDANKYNTIFEANRPMLKDANEIYPGQKLRIPAMATVQA
jgi:nucleoid-associated protein YgaU